VLHVSWSLLALADMFVQCPSLYIEIFIHKLQEYIHVLSRPLAAAKARRSIWTNVYLHNMVISFIAVCSIHCFTRCSYCLSWCQIRINVNIFLLIFVSDRSRDTAMATNFCAESVNCKKFPYPLFSEGKVETAIFDDSLQKLVTVATSAYFY